MKKYIIKRLIGSIIALLGAATVVFFLIRISGDPARLMLPPEASETQVQSLRQSLGLNDSIGIQYIRFIGDLCKGDLGTSLNYKQPALDIVLDSLPYTITLAVAAIIAAVILGILIGVISVLFRNSAFDFIANLFVLLGQSIPVFWLGIMFILLFSVMWRMFPTSGSDSAISLVLPAVSLAANPAATITRLIRSNLLEVIRQDYIRTAKAKGFNKWSIIFGQALKNAFIPVLTVIGLEFGTLLGGAVVTETIFAWPGIGRLLIEAVNQRDFPLVQACVLVISFSFVLVNFLVDLGYTLLDPRIKYE